MKRRPKPTGLRPAMPKKFMGSYTAAKWAAPGEGPADSSFGAWAAFMCVLRDRRNTAMVEWGKANGYTEQEMYGANGAGHELYREAREARERRP